TRKSPEGYVSQRLPDPSASVRHTGFPCRRQVQQGLVLSSSFFLLCFYHCFCHFSYFPTKPRKVQFPFLHFFLRIFIELFKIFIFLFLQTFAIGNIIKKLQRIVCPRFLAVNENISNRNRETHKEQGETYEAIKTYDSTSQFTHAGSCKTFSYQSLSL